VGNAMVIQSLITETVWLRAHPNLTLMGQLVLLANQERFGMEVNVYLFLNPNNLSH